MNVSGVRANDKAIFSQITNILSGQVLLNAKFSILITMLVNKFCKNIELSISVKSNENG